MTKNEQQNNKFFPKQQEQIGYKTHEKFIMVAVHYRTTYWPVLGKVKVLTMILSKMRQVYHLVYLPRAIHLTNLRRLCL